MDNKINTKDLHDSIFYIYFCNKHIMIMRHYPKWYGICHVMLGKESKTCPYDSSTMPRTMPPISVPTSTTRSIPT